MKEFTNVAGNVTSFAGNVNLFCPSWISWPGAWFERFSDIFRHHFHPQRVVSFRERAERGWKSGARSLSWKIGWNPCTLAICTGHSKISCCPTQLLYSRFHGLLRLIFHTNRCNSALQQLTALHSLHVSALSLKETTLSGWKWIQKFFETHSNHALVPEI